MNLRNIIRATDAGLFDRWLGAAATLRARLAGSVSETHLLILLAIPIGLGGGLGAVGFRWLIEAIRHLFLVEGAALLPKPWLFPLIPAAGGLLVGFIVLRWAREARGHGVPEVMAAVATEEGRIRPRVAIVKSIASAICIGSGGSVGREGPIVQIGSSIGSSLGQLVGFNDQRLKILVGCGAAAGISATFNAPIAGVIFALEVILGDFAITAFSPIIISSVLATALSRSMVGNEPAFLVPQYQTFSPHELGYHALLGITAGVIAVVFTRGLYRMEDLFEDWKFSDYAKPAIGGLILGGMGLYLPQVMGVGYDAITDVVHDRTGLLLLVLLFLAKFLATSITLGSGGSGGVFAPSLFMGATLGGAFGHVLQMTVDPAIEPGAYALVGMAAFVAGTTHAPLTAMLILFELTDDYKIILPLMLATTLSTLVAKWLLSESIYTLKLSRRGLSIAQGVDRSVLNRLRVREVARSNYTPIHPHTQLGEVVHLLQRDGHTDFPVVGDQGQLLGLVGFQDLRPVMLHGDLHPLLIAADMMRESAPAIARDETLMDALHLFSQTDVHDLPVIDSESGHQLVGMITRSALMERYTQEVRKQISRGNLTRNGRAAIPVGTPAKDQSETKWFEGSRRRLRRALTSRGRSRELVRLAAEGEQTVLKALLAEGVEPDLKDRDGVTPVMAATLAGQTEIVRMLLSAGADVNATNRWGWTPLVAAVVKGQQELVCLLLEAGADAEAEGKDHKPALLRAASRSDDDGIVEALLAAGASPDARDGKNCTPLMRAAAAGAARVVERLLMAGAEIGAVDKTGVDALMRGAALSRLEVARLLLAAGADPTIRDSWDRCALDRAASVGDPEMMELLLSSGSVTDEEKRRVLHDVTRPGAVITRILEVA